jgi:MscS family membrane protein
VVERTITRGDLPAVNFLSFRVVLRQLALLALLAAPAAAQIRLPNPFGGPAMSDSQAHSDSTARPTLVVEPGSPRQSVEKYFELAKEGRWNDAARYLSTGASDSARGAELAEHLKVVLDRHLWLDLDQLSPLAEGDTTDGLRGSLDQVGVIPRDNGLLEPVRMTKITRGGNSWWAFAPSVVRQVDTWYAELGDNWIRELFPEPLRRTGPLRVQWYQWLALLIVIPLIVLLGTALQRLLTLALQAVARRTPGTWDDDLLPQLRAPLLLFCVALFVAPITSWLGLNAMVNGFIASLIKAAVTAALFWALIRALGVIEKRVIASAWATQRADVLSLAPLGGRLAKVLVGFLGFAAVLSQFNIPVGTLLAGLGIGGIAIALGAQKTLENVIGSIAIVSDKPFEVGDWIKVEDIEGTVEQVGIRSTRIRTFDRTIISYPNGKLADMRLESFSARDRFRLNTVIGLVYGTTAAQMRQIVGEIEGALKGNPKVWQDTIIVRLDNLGAYALNVRIIAWFLAKDTLEFRDLNQEFLLQVLEIVERNGSSFAFPTQTLVMPSTPAPPRAPERPTPSA